MLPDCLTPADAPASFVELQPLAEVAGTHDLRAFVGRHAGDAVATLWHYLGTEGTLLLRNSHLAAIDLRGERITLERRGADFAVPLGPRRLLLHAPGQTPESLARALADARIELGKPAAR